MNHAHENQMMEMVVEDGCVGGVAPQANHGDWNMYWQAPAAAGGPAMSDQEQMHSVDDDQPVKQVNGYPKQAVVDKKQQQQNNQQQQKEAETHLPELEARDYITISIEDFGTCATGEFVRSNELQEGDFIVIDSDVKCGKYMIRGVKVRPQQGQRSEPPKKLPKMHRTQGN
ncbi:B3 domain-containing transcription factor ABI3-like protein [Drosera capensis]